MYHKSVLINEVHDALALKPNGIYIDATFGGGGHSRSLLEADKSVRVIAIDWDKNAIEMNAPALEKDFGGRFSAHWSNFATLYKVLKKIKVTAVDGILADFGTSQYQIHNKDGFSFRTETPLDMRMSTSHSKLTAEKIISDASEGELVSIFRKYGEEKFSRPIARAIVSARRNAPIKTTAQLALLVEGAIPAKARFKQMQKAYKIHPATKIFQALRIAVNNELEHIETFLKSAQSFLKPSGRLACISFHSLEDRLVKLSFRDHEQEGNLKIISRRPIVATDEEADVNRASRSAKLRVAEKL